MFLFQQNSADEHAKLLAEQQARIERLEREALRLRTENDELRFDLELLQTSHAELVEDNEELRGECDAKDFTIRVLKRDLENRSKAGRERSRELAELKVSNEQREARIGSQRETITRLKERIEERSGVQPWKECEICRFEYSRAVERTPRILKCGHTVCHGCASRLLESAQTIRCPYDRKTTVSAVAEDLPVNFLVLHM